MRGNYNAALNDNMLGLHLLGVEVNAAPTRREADIMFEQVKNEILAVGFDNILAIPRARDSRTDLAIALLNDAGSCNLNSALPHDLMLTLTQGRTPIGARAKGLQTSSDSQ